MDKDTESSAALAESITWTASKQTFYIIRCLVDRGRIPDAYRTYAYFRWVDDRLDEEQSSLAERMAFVERQQAIMESLYRREAPVNLTPEERMVAELVRSDGEPNSGLQVYVRNMMAVMVFDAQRRGRLISQSELNEYSRWLAMAVTEAMHYFIGHDGLSPKTETRYLAVTAAHIVHMLRDTRQDIAAGYINIPREFLESHALAPEAVDSPPYRLWVRSRVELARAYFKAGEIYLAQVENPRCRLAGYSYMARFTGTLDAIERNGYRLEANYAGGKRPGAALHIGWSVLALVLSHLHPERAVAVGSEAQGSAGNSVTVLTPGAAQRRRVAKA
jgi:phytoene/squalene synthetase